MLDFVQATPEGVNERAAMDFSQYLLSASPPSFGFDFKQLSLQSFQYSPHHPPSAANFNCGATTTTVSVSVTTDTPPKDNVKNFTKKDCPLNLNHRTTNSNTTTTPTTTGDDNFCRRGNCNLKPIIISSPQSQNGCSSDSEGESSSTTSSSFDNPQSPGKVSKTKKVSFADHKGLALAQVRFLNESPDEPPQLSSKILSLITCGANAGVESSPPLKLCFPQPASAYMAFRDKVMHRYVSLENVILEDYTVKGTIKVKNISFEKKVFVRFSMDEWVTFEDHCATYVKGYCSGFVNSDTFSFHVEIPPVFDVSKRLQFAVCFVSDGEQHWDNNDGSNYCIVSDNYEAVSDLMQPLSSPKLVNSRWLPEKKTESWSQFSAWRDIGLSGPFY